MTDVGECLTFGMSDEGWEGGDDSKSMGEDVGETLVTRDVLLLTSNLF